MDILCGVINMREILNRLDEMIRDMDYHNWSLDSEVYGGLTYKNIIELAIFIRKNTDYDNDYYVDMMCD